MVYPHDEVICKIKWSAVVRIHSWVPGLGINVSYSCLLHRLSENYLYVLHCFANSCQFSDQVLYHCSHESLWKHANSSWLNSLILYQSAFRSQYDVNNPSSDFLLLCLPNVSPRPLNINDKSSEGEKKAFQRYSIWSFFEAWRCKTTISFVTFIAALSLRCYTDSNTPETTASSNYPVVQQPRSHCCFFNKESLLLCTGKQNFTIHCKDHVWPVSVL